MRPLPGCRYSPALTINLSAVPDGEKVNHALLRIACVDDAVIADTETITITPSKVIM